MKPLSLALLALCAVSLGYIAYHAEPSYDATATINGQIYVMDHDLTYDDCVAEQKIYPSFVCARMR